MNTKFETLVIYRSDGSNPEVRVSTVEEVADYKLVEETLSKLTEEEVYSFFSRITGPATHWRSFTGVLEGKRPMGPTRVEDLQVQVDSATTNDDILGVVIDYLARKDIGFKHIVSFDAGTGELETLAYG